ncbi:MAG TPA: polysaccharide deacetylase family protein [Blastococcus sp.]|nr:polysaccharide deacetylase family protein [Blastococcus sp.]
MLFAGIAWTGRGFDVAALDGDGVPVTATSFPADRIAGLVDFLRALDEPPRGPLVCVVESTNGMIDGGLMAVGLRVHRADPWVLPARPGFGSVDARSLALAAVTRLPELPRLVLEEGSLTGRSADHARGVRESEAATARLAASGRCVSNGDRNGPERTVALTFDDGPNPPYTGGILDVLARYGVPATFFCVGLHAAAHPGVLARIAGEGHGLANHTWSHPFLPDLSVPEFAEQLERTDEVIERAGGAPGRRLFRPPYGSRNAETVSWLAESQDRATVVLWDVDANDWAMPGSEAISRTVLEQVRPGSIVLQHDGGGDRSQTVEALPTVIEGLLAQDYRFVLVRDMVP